MSLICIVEYENMLSPTESLVVQELWWNHSMSCSLIQDRLISLCLFTTHPQWSSLHGWVVCYTPPHVKLFDVGVKVKKDEFPSVNVSWNSAHSPSIHSVCKLGEFNCTQQPCEVVNQCPGSLIYSPRSCLLTCTSLDPPGQQQGSGVTQWSCREPLSGCVCPQGTVLLVGEKCSSLMDYFS